MSKKIFWVAVMVGATTGIIMGLVTTQAVMIQRVKKFRLETQLGDIVRLQKALEQKLSLIQTRQDSILSTLQAVKASTVRPERAGPAPEDLNKVYTIPVDNSPVKGNPEAKVTIVEFSDFQCPYSQRFHPAVAETLKSYPQDVKYILKNFPLQFHPNARPAAKAALAAREQGKYWEMTELLFAHGKELSEGKYKELAGQLGLDVKKFMKDYQEKDAEWERLITEDMATAAKIDVRGTPTFYINGKKTQARDLESWKAEVEKALKEKIK